MVKSDKGVSIWGLIVTLMIVGSTLSGIVSAGDKSTTDDAAMLDTGESFTISRSFTDTPESQVHDFGQQGFRVHKRELKVNPAAGGVALWHMDENSGPTIFDSTQYHNDGTRDGTQWTTGISGAALEFDGVDDYVEVHDSASLDIDDKITVEAWVKVAELGSKYHFIVSKHYAPTGYTLFLTSSNKFGFEINSQYSVDSVTVPELGKWYYVVGTYDQSQLKIYINGVLENTKVCTAELATNNQNLRIGQWSAGGYCFKGIIDEVGIYARALTESEIQKQYSEQTEIKFTGSAIEYHVTIGASYWNVSVDELISGPQPCSDKLNVITSWSAPPGPPWGYVDPNIEEGDKVEVYGMYREDGPYVILEGSEDYYIKKITDQEEWSEDIRITNDPADSVDPRIAVDSTNNVHIVWRDDRDGNGEIYYSKLDNYGNTLIDDTQLTFNNQADSYSPAIDIDSNNNIHIVWGKGIADNIEIYYTKLDNNGNTLVDDKRIKFCSGMWVAGVAIAVDPDNNIHITWSFYGAGETGHIFYAKLDNNGNTLISKQLTFESYAQGSTRPRIAIGTGYGIYPYLVHIVWERWTLESPDNHEEIFYAELDNNGNILINNRQMTFTSTILYNHNPDIDTDSAGNVHIAWWVWENFENSYIFYTKLDNYGNSLVGNKQLTYALDIYEPLEADISYLH